MRSPAELIGEQPHCPSDDEETGARALSTGEVGALVEDFILAAKRAEAAGFDGVEVHGAHGYSLSQFLSPEINRREDEYGGDLPNRARLLCEVIRACSPAVTRSLLTANRRGRARAAPRCASAATSRGGGPSLT